MKKSSPCPGTRKDIEYKRIISAKIGETGTVLKTMKFRIDGIKIRKRVEIVQTMTLLRSSSIRRRGGDLRRLRRKLILQ